jgi:hypothetical protein
MKQNMVLHRRLVISCLTLSVPNEIPSVIRVTLVASKVFTHTSHTRKLSALIQC